MKDNNKSKKKLLAWIDEFVDSDYFQKKKTEFREKYGVPETGFDSIKEEQVKEELKFEAAVGGTYLPIELKMFSDEQYEDMRDFIEEIVRPFPIIDETITLFIKVYLLHDVRFYELLYERFGSVDLCRVADSWEDLLFYGQYLPLPDDEKEGRLYGLIEEEFRSYPVVLKLHSEITQNGLVDYIKKNWNVIDYHLSEYRGKSQIAKTRPRNAHKKELYNFIYENKELPRKKLMRMVSDRFNEVLGYDHINKIISIEGKRRRQM